MTIRFEPSIVYLLNHVRPDSILLKFLSTLFESAEMNNKEGFKFWLTLLKADSYFTWSNDMEVVFRVNGLWKFDEPRVGSENSEECDEASTSLTEADET